MDALDLLRADARKAKAERRVIARLEEVAAGTGIPRRSLEGLLYRRKVDPRRSTMAALAAYYRLDNAQP